MMIEFKSDGRTILVNPDQIEHINCYMDANTTWIYFNNGSIQVNHSYEDVIKKIDAAAGILRLEEQITNFEDFKKQ